MSKDNFVKKSIVALTLVFSSAIMPVALSDNDIIGVWQNDEVGIIALPDIANWENITANPNPADLRNLLLTVIIIHHNTKE